ncbi:MAG: helix-turn-helix domain-containing protein [Oscillospiraceae bacterium]|nr:helix-turn-helix domain-containing protein [Oscillospiraceae bacterium]
MNETMGAIIARKRKELGLTQEQLAGELNISYQAVSKWENELSSPDIMTLPLLADLFGITIDELFGRERPQAAAPERALVHAPSTEEAKSEELPWPDDDTLRAVLFIGRVPVEDRSVGKQPITLHIEGDALNVRSEFDVEIEGEVQGSVSAGGDVDCGDVGGDVNAGGDVDCGSVEGNVQAGGDVDCGGVEGNVQAGGDVDCGSVEGSLSAGGDVDCSAVGGSVYAEGDVDCGSVRGRVFRDGDDDDGSGKKKKGFIF